MSQFCPRCHDAVQLVTRGSRRGTAPSRARLTSPPPRRVPEPPPEPRVRVRGAGRRSAGGEGGPAPGRERPPRRPHRRLPPARASAGKTGAGADASASPVCSVLATQSPSRPRCQDPRAAQGAAAAPGPRATRAGSCQRPPPATRARLCRAAKRRLPPHCLQNTHLIKTISSLICVYFEVHFVLLL